MVRRTAVKKMMSSEETQEEHAPVPQENGKLVRDAEIAQKPVSTASEESAGLPAKGSSTEEGTAAETTDARGTKRRGATSKSPSTKGRKLPLKASRDKDEPSSNGQEASEEAKNGSLLEKRGKRNSSAPAEESKVEDTVESTNPVGETGPKAKASQKAAVRASRGARAAKREQEAPKESSIEGPQPCENGTRAARSRNKKAVRKPAKDNQDEEPNEASELVGSKDSSITREGEPAETQSPTLNEQHQEKPDKEPEPPDDRETSVKGKANMGKRAPRRTANAKQEQPTVENRKSAESQVMEKKENPGREPKQPEHKETSVKGKANGGRRAPKRTVKVKQEQLEVQSTENTESQEIKKKEVGIADEGSAEEPPDTAEDKGRRDPFKRGKKRGASMAAVADHQTEANETKKLRRACQRKKVPALPKKGSAQSVETVADTQPAAAKGGATKRQKNIAKAAKTSRGTEAGPSLDTADTKEEEKDEPSRKRLRGEDAKTAGNKGAAETTVRKFEGDKTSKLWNLKICSWNVNGVRSWLGKDGLGYLKTEDPDILTIQETKCADAKLPKEIKEPEGYHAYFIGGDQGGYSGVGLLSKVKPVDVKYGIGTEKHDKEGRVVTAEYEKFFLVATYVPNAGRKLVRLEYRVEWDKDFCSYLQELEKKKPVILCGDLNVAHQAVDLANPKANRRNAGFTDEERAGFTTLLSKGFLDSFRHLYPDAKKAYTFWTYMMNARAKDVGWRLDYFVLSKSLEANLSDSIIQKEVMGSDHCPIKLLLNM